MTNGFTLIIMNVNHHSQLGNASHSGAKFMVLNHQHNKPIFPGQFLIGDPFKTL